MYNNAVIVLGCGIDAAGNLSPDATNSVQLAMEAINNNSGACLVMTGYISYKTTFKPSISEAQAMKDYAVSFGFPANKIFVETESKDTLGNLFFTKQNLLVPLNITDVAIVRGPNQSAERINYLAKKVLGSSYSYKLIEPDVCRPEEIDREHKSLALAKRWLDEVDDGDMGAIYQLMRNKHPGYNSSIHIATLRELI